MRTGASTFEARSAPICASAGPATARDSNMLAAKPVTMRFMVHLTPVGFGASLSGAGQLPVMRNGTTANRKTMRGRAPNGTRPRSARLDALVLGGRRLHPQRDEVEDGCGA